MLSVGELRYQRKRGLMQIEEKLKALHQLELQKLQIANQLKLCNANIETAMEEIVDEFESRQLQHINIDGIGTFYKRTSVMAPKLLDPQMLRTWLDRNGFNWEMVTAFNSQKLRGLYNELLEQGRPLPEGVAPPFTKSVIVLNK